MHYFTIPHSDAQKATKRGKMEKLGPDDASAKKSTPAQDDIGELRKYIGASIARSVSYFVRLRFF